jgi:presenilin-like A22 family membrane protease
MADDIIQFFHNFAVAEIAKLGATAVVGISFIYVDATKVDLVCSIYDHLSSTRTSSC